MILDREGRGRDQPASDSRTLNHINAACHANFEPLIGLPAAAACLKVCQSSIRSSLMISAVVPLMSPCWAGAAWKGQQTSHHPAGGEHDQQAAPAIQVHPFQQLALH